MAAYTFTHTNTAVTFTVTGLSPGDSVAFYVRTEPYSGSMLVDQVFTAAGTRMTQTFSVLSTGNSYAVNVAVNDVQIGAQYFNTAPARPDNWAWTSAISSGSSIKISAQEWNSFCDRINEFRVYKGLPKYGLFVTVSKGTPISVAIVNHARWAISVIPGCGSVPSEPVAGKTVITASFFSQLRTALNAVT